jgi:transposase
MAFREVSVVGIKEVLRLWLMGRGQRAIATAAQVDRKTVRRYIAAAQAAGLTQQDDPEAITDELLGSVAEAVRPGRRPGGHGTAWALLSTHRDYLKGKLEADLKLTKVHDLFVRHTGVNVPYRTLHRFCVQELAHGAKKTTVRIADCDPGEELQVDFGRMGLIFDNDASRRRVVWALIFTAVYSRHMFVWLTFTQGFSDVISGCEAAWEFFGGVFKVVIPDNLKAIVTKADAIDFRLNDGFLEYAQSRGFVVDPARVAHPQDKPRVERAVSYVRESFFKGESFVGLKDAQVRAHKWCLVGAGQRIHRTTQRRPAEVFDQEEAACLLPAPVMAYDIPIYRDAKVHKDHHVEVARALYSVPTEFVGCRVQVRADSHLVTVFFRGQLIKVHPRKGPGQRSTDPNDYPTDKRAYATRDLDHLVSVARSHGHAIGTYAARLLDNPLPWTKMRQVYRLLGLVRRYGQGRVEAACDKALELEVVDVSLITRMLERALEDTQPDLPAASATVVPLRFARETEHFATEPTRRSK